MKRFTLAVLALALVGGGALFAQEAKKDDCCAELHKAYCVAKDGKCEKACESIGLTVKAAFEQCMEACKKEGLKCAECEKPGAKPPCEPCKKACGEIVSSAVKAQAAAKDAKHGDASCTLTTGPACQPCAKGISEALLKKCREMGAPKK